MLGRENIANVVAGNNPNQNNESRDVPNYNSEIFRAPRRAQASYADLKFVFVEIYEKNQKVFALVTNIIFVLVLTVFFTKLLSSDCLADDSVILSEANVFCDPYHPMDRVVVDIDLNTSSHCYSSKSCVALGERLSKDQGRFRYNFIIGAYGYIYVEHGYTCQSEAIEDALYILLPVDSIYNGQDFMAANRAVAKFHEILREGLECGMVQRNYSITARGCGKFNDWCTKMLHELVVEDPADRGASGPRISYYDKTVPRAFFNPLNLNRVYSYQYKLVVCTKAPNK